MPPAISRGGDATRRSPRRSLTIVVASTALSGCLATDPPATPALSAKDAYTQHAWPAMARCVGCHGAQPAIDFLAPGTPDGAYVTMFAFQPPVVNLDSPGSSLVLTMGKHTGPPLEPTESAAILDWLDKERDERTPPTTMPIVIGPVTPALDAPTTIALGHGATLSFLATSFDGDLDVSQIQIATTSALHVTHPLFVSRPASGVPVVDAIDHFDDIDLDIAANTTLPLTSATFLDFVATDPITIHFLKLEAP